MGIHISSLGNIYSGNIYNATFEVFNGSLAMLPRRIRTCNMQIAKYLLLIMVMRVQVELRRRYIVII